MFIELVDALRCPTEHEDTWLVAASTRMDGRHIMDGALGCPICRREYPIRGGIVRFGGHADVRNAYAPRASAPPDDVMRLAALLGLDVPGGTVALFGHRARAAQELVEMAEVQALAIDPEPNERMGGGVSGIQCGDRLPLAAAVLRGAALAGDTPVRLRSDVVRALATGGRLLAPAATPLPAGVTELARDELEWVAEKSADAPRTIQLSRARSQ